ncbi:unnamed protein product [Amoebophrya sp. A120]|nr:unnamed protein product [Amoebophrya sp. A120]|eukprot:GSA120T00001708001.1
MDYCLHEGGWFVLADLFLRFMNIVYIHIEIGIFCGSVAMDAKGRYFEVGREPRHVELARWLGDRHRVELFCEVVRREIKIPIPFSHRVLLEGLQGVPPKMRHTLAPGGVPSASLRALLLTFVSSAERSRFRRSGDLLADELEENFMVFFRFAMLDSPQSLATPNLAYIALVKWFEMRSSFLHGAIEFFVSEKFPSIQVFVSSMMKLTLMEFEHALLQQDAWQRRKFPILALSDVNAGKLAKQLEVAVLVGSSVKKYRTVCKKSTIKSTDLVPGIFPRGDPTDSRDHFRRTKKEKISIFLNLPIEIWRFEIIPYL